MRNYYLLFEEANTQKDLEGRIREYAERSGVHTGPPMGMMHPPGGPGGPPPMGARWFYFLSPRA